ncbi:hypothetical protein ABTM48_19990, partial [Acinetobacter baumannii]
QGDLGTTASDALWDIQCLVETTELLDTILEAFDAWRVDPKKSRPDEPPLTREEVNILFQIRATVRELMIALHQRSVQQPK